MPLDLRPERPGFVIGVTATSKIAPGAPGVAPGARLGARGQENYVETSLAPMNSPGLYGCSRELDFSALVTAHPDCTDVIVG